MKSPFNDWFIEILLNWVVNGVHILLVRCSGFYTNFKNYKVEKIQLWEGKLNLFHGLTERSVSVIEFLSLTGAIWLMKSGYIR